MRELIADIFPEKCERRVAVNVTSIEGAASLGEIEEHDSENEFSSFPKESQNDGKASTTEMTPTVNKSQTLLTKQDTIKQPAGPSARSANSVTAAKRTISQRDAAMQKPKVKINAAVTPQCGLC